MESRYSEKNDITLHYSVRHGRSNIFISGGGADIGGSGVTELGRVWEVCEKFFKNPEVTSDTY